MQIASTYNIFTMEKTDSKAKNIAILKETVQVGHKICETAINTNAALY
jgi:hypothetical protein